MSPPSGSPNTPSSRKVKVSQVLNQMDETELDLMNPEDLQRTYDRYVNKMGSHPSPDEECTHEQITALAVLGQSGAPLYVDLSVRSPPRLMRGRSA